MSSSFLWRLQGHFGCIPPPGRPFPSSSASIRASPNIIVIFDYIPSTITAIQEPGALLRRGRKTESALRSGRIRGLPVIPSAVARASMGARRRATAALSVKQPL